VVIVFVTVSVVTLLAILGFEKLTQFSKVCVPWIFLVFVAGAIALLPSFGPIHSAGDLWTIANEKIWTGVPTPGVEKFGFWHITFFAWFANLAMHVDLSDMATLRYAKSWKVGFLSALGMYPGHMLAWICSGILVAAVARELNPGLMAYTAAGLSGAAAVVIAGWTTANPTMYRAGLAFQAVTRNWARWKVTLLAGTVTTAVACFPAAFMRLLDFVALYGLVLMPIGAVVFAEHWLIPKIGLAQYRCETRGGLINVPAALSWVITLAFCWAVPLHLYFKFLPGWFVAVGVYLLGAWLEARYKAKAV
jgi:purine-cytosine permease-like protein